MVNSQKSYHVDVVCKCMYTKQVCYTSNIQTGIHRHYGRQNTLVPKCYKTLAGKLYVECM